MRRGTAGPAPPADAGHAAASTGPLGAGAGRLPAAAALSPALGDRSAPPLGPRSTASAERRARRDASARMRDAAARPGARAGRRRRPGFATPSGRMVPWPLATAPPFTPRRRSAEHRPRLQPGTVDPGEDTLSIRTRVGVRAVRRSVRLSPSAARRPVSRAARCIEGHRGPSTRSDPLARPAGGRRPSGCGPAGARNAPAAANRARSRGAMAGRRLAGLFDGLAALLHARGTERARSRAPSPRRRAADRQPGRRRSTGSPLGPRARVVVTTLRSRVRSARSHARRRGPARCARGAPTASPLRDAVGPDGPLATPEGASPLPSPTVRRARRPPRAGAAEPAPRR